MDVLVADWKKPRGVENASLPARRLSVRRKLDGCLGRACGLEETARIVKEVMENASLPARRLSVRLVVNCGIGVDWAQAHR